MSKLTVTVKQKDAGVEGFYQLPYSTKAKIATKAGETLFLNKGSLSQAAKRFAKALGLESELVEDTKSKKTVSKVVKQTKNATNKCEVNTQTV